MSNTTLIEVGLGPEQLKAIGVIVRAAVQEALANNKEAQPESATPITKIPLKFLYEAGSAHKIGSKPFIYSLIKTGKITLYKIGSRSYADLAQVNEVFHASKITARA